MDEPVLMKGIVGDRAAVLISGLSVPVLWIHARIRGAEDRTLGLSKGPSCIPSNVDSGEPV